MQPSPAEIEELLRRREAVQRRAMAELSPSERLARMVELQVEAWRMLQASPEGMRHFLRRNYRSRRAEVIDGRWQPVSPDRCPVPP